MAERFTAARADIEWQANTGTVKAEVESLRRSFRESTSAMSSDTLRLAVAQDKLDKALLRHGPASAQAKRAEIDYRRELEATTRATEREAIALSRSERAKRSLRTQTSGLAATFGGQLRGGIGLATTSMIGGAGLVYALQTSINAASDLNEQLSRSQQIFGSSAASISDWSTKSVDNLSLTRAEALRAAGDFGTLFDTVGLAPDRAAQLSRQLVQLGADLSSFQDTPLEDSLAAIRSGLVGESEPLRKYGALLSEARVQQEAMAETGKKSAKSLTDQEKVIARVTLIMRDTVNAQGDLARTSDSYANSSRRLSARIKEYESSLGKILLPTAEEVIDKTDKGSKGLSRLGVTAQKTGVVFRQVFRTGTLGPAGLVLNDWELLNAIIGDTKATLDATTASAAAFNAQFGLGALTTSAGAVAAGRVEDVRGRPGKPKRRPAKYTGLSVDQQIKLARLENTPGTSDEEAYLRELLARVRAAQGDKRLKKDELLGLVQLEGTLNNDIQAIVDERNAANERAAEKVAAANKRAADKRAAAARRQKAEQERTEAAVRAALNTRVGPYANTSQGFANGKPVGAGLGAKTTGAATAEQIAAAVAQATSQMVAVEQRYAPNFQLSTGRLETHGYETVAEIRRQTLVIEGLAARTKFPASGYAVASAEAAL